MPHHSWKIFIGCLSRTGFISKYFCLCLSVSITLVHLILLQCSLFILLLASAYDLQKTPPGFRNTKCILELSYLLLTDHFTSLHQNCGIFSLLHFVHLVLWLCLRNNWNHIFFHIDLFFVCNCFWFACMYSLHHHKPLWSRWNGGIQKFVVCMYSWLFVALVPFLHLLHCNRDRLQHICFYHGNLQSVGFQVGSDVDAILLGVHLCRYICCASVRVWFVGLGLRVFYRVFGKKKKKTHRQLEIIQSVVLSFGST